MSASCQFSESSRNFPVGLPSTLQVRQKANDKLRGVVKDKILNDNNNNLTRSLTACAEWVHDHAVRFAHRLRWCDHQSSSRPHLEAETRNYPYHLPYRFLWFPESPALESLEIINSTRGHQFPPFWGANKHHKSIVIFRDFPRNAALFGLVIWPLYL